jgi:ribosome-binding factor A
MTRRTERLNEIIKKELGQILLRDFELGESALVTLTRVDTSPDLSSTRVYVSVFPEKLSQPVLKALISGIYFWQQKINERLQMRPVPRLFFCQEKETVSAGRIDELLEKTKTKAVLKKGRKIAKMS